MIRSFRDKDTGQVFDRVRVATLSAAQTVAQRKLYMLDAAGSLEDLKSPPGNRLEKLRGDRKGQYCLRINDQWRVCFRWAGGDAHDVEIVDYHRG